MSYTDPLQLPLLRDRLIGATEEAAVALARTAFSPVIRDANDSICMLLDINGNAIAENRWAIPAFIGCLPACMRHILQKYPLDRWQPGDAILTNDPWIATGHLPDITIVTPVFHGDRVIAFTGTVGHMVDMGGVLASASTQELFEEGLRIPVQYLYQNGHLNDILVEFIRANLRVPEVVLGDIQAMLAANRIMERRIQEIVIEGGIDDLGAIASALHDKAEAVIRNAIEAVPDGDYFGECQIDGFNEPLQIKLKILVRGSEMILDYSGTSPQQPYAVNCPIINTSALSKYVLKCIFDPETPRNEGSYRPITVTAPDRSLVNAQFPAAVNARHLTFLHLDSVIFQALVDVVPEKVIAESGTPMVAVVISGSDRDGRPFVHYTMDQGGMGARANKDGLSATPYPNNVSGGGVEMIEFSTPLMFCEKSLVPDSGGIGKYRGGLGTLLEIENLGPNEARVSIMGDRVRFPARGLLGGGPGMPGMVEKNGQPINPKGRTTLSPGEKIAWRNAGGGGYGLPKERNKKLIARDLLFGYVTECKKKVTF